jgi:isopentenyl diphosphate isomerase/L-lactate dehydrogenase-like FMN-dependent dehydrogenase
MTSTRAVIRKIDQLRTEFRTAMFLLGRARVADLIHHTAALGGHPFRD